jgi:hypothetical protein
VFGKTLRLPKPKLKTNEIEDIIDRSKHDKNDAEVVSPLSSSNSTQSRILNYSSFMSSPTSMTCTSSSDSTMKEEI